jgi:glycosyltransferase involved in cell wall biosynthesis
LREPIHVLQVLSDAQPGGGMTQLLQFVRWTDPARVAWQFAVPDDGPLPDALRALGARVHTLNITSRFDIGAIRRLVRLCREEQFQVVHSHNVRANVHSRIGAVRAGVPVQISTIHNSVYAYDVSRARQRLYAAAERRTAAWATRIIAVSDGIADELVRRYGIEPAKVVVIPNGIEPDRLQPARTRAAVRAELGIDASAPMILQVGRLTPQKGYDLLIAAMPAIRERHPDVQLLCVGDGPDRELLEALAASHYMEDQIHFAGHREDVPDLLAAADLVVLASRSEGMPYTLLEAMGMGLAVVATRIGGIADVVEDRTTGVLVPPESSPALARAIVDLLGDEPRRERLGSAARSTVMQSFTAGAAAAAVVELYQSSVDAIGSEEKKS